MPVPKTKINVSKAKKVVAKKKNILDKKKWIFDVKFELFEVFEKIESIVQNNKGHAYFDKTKLERRFAELKAISIKIKNTNISKQEQNNLLKGIAITINKHYLKIKSKLSPQNRSKLDRYYMDLMKNVDWKM